MSKQRPLVVIVAGPNGAGKSTSASFLLREALRVDEFVNADVIARGLSEFNPDGVAFQAGRVMLRRMKELAKAKASFAFETTLASRTFLRWLEELHGDGYHSHIAFLALPTPEFAVARVASRVRFGGHDVPEEVVRRRFGAGLFNFFRLYRPVVSSWQLFDNMHLEGPRLIAAGRRFQVDTVVDHRAWQTLNERYEP